MKTPTRKELRKQKRKEKKVHKKEWFSKNKKPVLNQTKPENVPVAKEVNKPVAVQKKKKSAVDNLQDDLHKKEKQEFEQLQRAMQKERMKQLRDANKDEDRTIKQLEKRLKLTKRKSKSLPKTFAADGLDYLLEVCDPESVASVAAAEQQLKDAGGEFDEDLALIADDDHKNKDSEEISEEGSDLQDFSEEDFGDEEEDDIDDFEDEDLDDDDEEEENLSEDGDDKGFARKQCSKNKKQKIDADSENEGSESEKISTKEDDESENNESDSENEEKAGTWTDIYGRLRGKDGSIMEESSEKYIPPGKRAAMAAGQSEDKKTAEKLLRLQRQLKGLVNRLAESNMHSISTQIENLYMNNSRNDMNETLTNLLLESLISPVFTPERLLLEHVMLVTILHANVGTEIGAYFLQVVVKKFDDLTTKNQEMEDKTLDNIAVVLAQLYNFKVFECKLIHEIIERLKSNFEEEKHIECILHILKNVGFTLRKDDPLALKGLILDIQKKAAAVREETKKENPRVKFMLDVLMAIKNNNMTKIPNYDTSYAEHLKKLMKSFVRKGNYVTQLNISLEDLLKADERGKWWVVGSAWRGNAVEKKTADDKVESESYSQELLDLAKKQRMNTDTRKRIFCTVVSAEDYLDAFVKLIQLGLKPSEEREITNVILHICLHEKPYNPYYALVAQKFCEYDRKYQMNVRCSIWDKLQALNKCKPFQLGNLSKFLTHLFIEKGLPISTLKKFQFSDLDNISLRFMRQILLGILLHEDSEACLAVFQNIAVSDQLKMFRESLRLFIHQFLLKNLQDTGVADDKKKLLESRAQMVEKLLSRKQRSKLW